MTLTLPSDEVIEAIHGSVTHVVSRVDIYEADGDTLWLANAPVLTGRISLSNSRDERRTASFTFANVDGVLSSDPDGFWYDKVIKPYRGTKNPDWEGPLGEFFIDRIEETHFPHVVSVTARDATKKLLTAKFATSVTFATNSPVENVIYAIAYNGGIPASRIGFTLTGKSTGRDFLFDPGTERWKAMKDIAGAYDFDLFFDANGILRLTGFQDPSDPGVSPAEYRFETGPGTNRIVNPKFTTPLSGDLTRVAGWDYDFDTSGASYQNTENNLKIINTGASSGSVASTSFPVVAGEEWRLTYSAKAYPETSSGRTFRLIFSTTENEVIGGPGYVSYVDLDANEGFAGELTEYSTATVIPAGATYMRVVLYANATGSSYVASFDDVSAVKTFPLVETQGNLATFTRSTADERLYNHVVVTGQANDQLPVVAEAENNNPDSPTRIARIGRRTYFYNSSFISTVLQAQAVADSFLKVHALEQYEVRMDALVVPYLDVNIIVEFFDPRPTSSLPIRFLLTDLEIPLELATMTSTAKRVTVVG